MQTTTITRKQLYDQVWAEPMRRLAARYGISDVGLAKLCRKHDIPRPGRGYWAKKEFGKAPPQTPLPNPSDNGAITLRDPDTCRFSSPGLRETVEEAAADEGKREAKIEVAGSLRGAHPLVSQANQALKAAETDENRLIVPSKGVPLRLRVSKSSLRRALLVMDALIKALVRRGYEVELGPTVSILNASVRFSITEALDTRREQPAEHDLAGYYHFGHSRFNTKRVPSGRLALHIDDADAYWASGCRKTWRDAKKQRVEDRLNQFVAGLVRFAARRKEHEEEEEKAAQRRRDERRRQQEEAERRAEKRRLIQAEQARVESLMQEARSWTSSQNLRLYIEARRREHLANHGETDPDGEFAHWLVWATQQADRLDPIAESPPSILDEPMPEEPEPRSWWERG